MDTKYWIGIAVVVAILSCLAGAFAFPTTVTETVYEEVEVEKIVEVPVEVEVIKEVEVPVEVLVEVPYENTTKLEELQARYDNLQRRFEMLIDEDIDEDEIEAELDAIERAKEELEDEWKFLFIIDDYKPSELEFVKFYDEDASIREVRRWVDGKRVYYDKAKVSFEVKVRYSDSDGTEYERFDVEVTWDLDEDGVETSEIEFELS